MVLTHAVVYYKKHIIFLQPFICFYDRSLLRRQCILLPIH